MTASCLFFHNFVGNEQQMLQKLFKPNLLKSRCTAKAHQRRDRANVHDVIVVVVVVAVILVVVVERDY